MTVRLELWPYRLRLAAPLATAHGEISAREGWLVRITDGGDRAGLGEVAPLPTSGTEAPDQAHAALERCAAEALLNRLLACETPAALDSALDALGFLARTPAARAGLEQTLLDLLAQRAGVPLFRLLEPSARGEVQVSALLSGGTPGALAREAAAAVRAGFDTLKLKVAGRPLQEDLMRLAAVRAAAGPSVRLRLDANGGWSAPEAALALRAFAVYAPELCEQPLAPGAPEAWRGLRAQGEVLLAADESLADPAEADALISAGAGARAVDALVLKPPALGGLWRALRLARRGREAGLASYATTFLEGAIGRAGAAHLAAALGGPLAHGLATGRLLAEDLAPEVAEVAGGALRLGERPGLGVALAAAAFNARAPGPQPQVPPAWLECPVARAARLTPRAPALIAGAPRGARADGGETVDTLDTVDIIDYASLETRVRAFAAGLRARGVGRGDTVALLTEAVPDAVALLFAAGRVGACLALLNARLLPAEIAVLAERATPRLRVAWGPLAGMLPGAIALEALAATDADADAATLDPDAAWTLIFTSGTTGAPKAAEATVAAHFASARATNALLGLGASTRFVCCLPLFHVGGLSIAVRCALAGGAALLIPRFEAEAVARALARGATHASLVATTLARTLDVRERNPVPGAAGSAERVAPVVLVGGGPVPAALLERARQSGLSVLQTYGLTEACSQVTCERLGDADGATAGPAMPGATVRVVDGERRPLPPDAEGEIEVSGPSLFRGYRGDPAATAAALDGAWLRTGDVGVLDPRGRLRVLARRTDLIVSGGENVYPAEVEAVLLLHPAVAEVAVAARPDAMLGETVVALVVARGGTEVPARLDEVALRAFCRLHLAGFKVPREVREVVALPRTAAGKVDRRALRRMLE